MKHQLKGLPYFLFVLAYKLNRPSLKPVHSVLFGNLVKHTSSAWWLSLVDMSSVYNVFTAVVYFAQDAHRINRESQGTPLISVPNNPHSMYYEVFQVYPSFINPGMDKNMTN